MTPSRFAIVLTASVMCTGMAAAQDFELAGVGRDPGVERWIWYEIVGPRNHPLPIVYISTQPFKTMSDELLVVLPPARFDVISTYTRARIARPDCPGKVPTRKTRATWYTVVMTQHEKGLTRSCVLPRAKACNDFSGALKLPGIHWTTAERGPITLFMAEVTCNARGAGK